MKIEVGKCYVTRDGRKVGPVTEIEPPDWQGREVAVIPSADRSARQRWWSDGRANLSYDSTEDLVAGWLDAPVREVTRLDLNAGRYGVLQIGEYINGSVPLSFVTKTHYDAADVRAATETLTAILPVLEQGN